MTSKETIVVGGLEVDVIRKSALKNMYIRINPPEGDVSVSAPNGTDDEVVRNFLLSKMPEIIKNRDRMAAQPRQAKREYVSGEACYLWGKPYMLQVNYEGSSYKIAKTGSKILMTAPVGTTEEGRKKAITEWYRSELKRTLPEVLHQCEKRIGVEVNACNIKYMHTRWGSCNISEKRILINLQLVKKPPMCLEYVITHELVHLLEQNHTSRFTSLVEMYFPNWKEAKRLLEDMPLDYMEQGESTDEECSDIC